MRCIELLRASRWLLHTTPATFARSQRAALRSR